MTTGYETTMEDTRHAIEGGKVEDLIERMAERVGGKASVHAVFGDPIERNGITVIPVARIRWGFGGGGGTASAMTGQPAESEVGEPVAGGSGGGGGVMADPVGYLEIGPEGVSYKTIMSPMPSPGFLLAAGATGALILRGLAKLFRR
jgi:uncharacterized spore protein YtfJ